MIIHAAQSNPSIHPYATPFPPLLPLIQPSSPTITRTARRPLLVLFIRIHHIIARPRRKLRFLQRRSQLRVPRVDELEGPQLCLVADPTRRGEVMSAQRPVK